MRWNTTSRAAAVVAFVAVACTDAPSEPPRTNPGRLDPAIAATNIVTCPPTIPPGHQIVYCFDFDFAPGVWHGFILQQSATPGQLSHQYLLLAPTNFGYVVPGTTLNTSVNSYTFQPEFNSVVWNDVVRFMLSDLAPPTRMTIAVAKRVSNTAPVASIGGPYAGDEGSAIAFSAAGSADAENDPLTYDWDFGDGTTGTGVSPSHAYADNGSYTATVSVRDGALSSTASASVAIGNVAPTGTFVSPSFVAQGSSYTLSMIGVKEPSSVDLASLAFRFKCGLSWGAVLSVTSDSCTAPVTIGTIQVRGSIRDKDQGLWNVGRSVIVTNVAPIVVLNTSSVTVPLGTPVTIAGAFSDPGTGDNPWTGRVVWGQGTIPLGAVSPGGPMSRTLSYTSRGRFEARIEVTDKHGATGRGVMTVFVQ